MIKKRRPNLIFCVCFTRIPRFFFSFFLYKIKLSAKAGDPALALSFNRKE